MPKRKRQQYVIAVLEDDCWRSRFGGAMTWQQMRKHIRELLNEGWDYDCRITIITLEEWESWKRQSREEQSEQPKQQTMFTTEPA